MENSRCSGCRRERELAEFDLDARGNHRKTCRECLVRDYSSLPLIDTLG